MKIIETFPTLQGEGKYIGIPSYFVRTTGCNLRCGWRNDDSSVTLCDTPYTSFKPEKGESLDLKVLKDRLKGTFIKHIVVTGGEPTIQKDLGKVVNELIDSRFFVTIETNGTVYIEGIERAFMSISPKLRNSQYAPEERDRLLHATNNTFLHVCSKYMASNDYQFKFVVSEKHDLLEVTDVRYTLNIPPNRIYLMPQGIDTESLRKRGRWLWEECVERGYNFSPRLHIDLFGNEKER